MKTDPLSFRKAERIVSQKQIDELFGSHRSQSMAAFPLRAVYIIKERQEGQQPVQILISVPKKRLHHAVDRNRTKRQIREAYRHHKQLLADTIGSQQAVDIAFIWLTDQLRPSPQIDNCVKNLLQRIARKL